MTEWLSDGVNAHAYPCVAFDTIDHALLLNTLSNAIGVKDRCLLTTQTIHGVDWPVSSRNPTS